MNKKNIVIIFIISILFLLGIISILFYLNLITYAITLTIIEVILVIFLFIFLNNNRSEDSIYKSDLKRIIKTYDSVLVKINDIPDFTEKEVIRVDYFEDLINAQEEVKKPIFYIEDNSSTTFILIDESIICVHILKVNYTIKNQVEEKITQDKIKSLYRNVDESILKDIENTTIIKLSNNKTFRVSPLKKIEEFELPRKKEDIKDL